MVRVFVEYKVKQEKRAEYLQHMEAVKQEVEREGGCGFFLYEGADQPQLFVEMFDVESLADYRALKERRKWDAVLPDFIEGGAEKVNIWAFEQVNVGEGKDA